MTLEDVAARLEQLERQNAALLRGLGEVLELLRARARTRPPAPAPEQLEQKRTRWNASGWWEVFLEGTGWMRDWNNKAPPPGGGR